ncbi:MAG: chemotaxis protein CheX [Proteobacteria bacterium]|nr:chemotaxis protein CheX [Pseudomonadota bacterium]
MRAEYINAFLVPSVRVLQQMARIQVKLGKVARLDDGQLGENLSIIIGVQGRLSGSVVLTASPDVAWALAGRILGEQLGADGHSEVQAILAEVANTIVGNATGHLYELGLREGITPPTVVAGAGVQLDFGAGVESVKVPIQTELGSLEMIVSLTRESP